MRLARALLRRVLSSVAAGRLNSALDEIKALSADEVKQYLAGAGMGYAKSAELNPYLGPSHALELADQLDLTAEQRVPTKRLLDAHRVEVQPIGARLIEAEGALEGLLRSGSVGEAQIADAVRKTAALQGEYRLSHLETHRRQRAVLSEEQVARYDALRGHASATGPRP